MMPTAIPNRDALRVSGRVPVLSATKYDITTAAQIAVAVNLAMLTGVLLVIWLCNLQPSEPSRPMVLMSSGTGVEDGEPEETLDVKSQEEPSDRPSPFQNQQLTELKQVTEQLETLSQNAAQLTDFDALADEAGGNPGSATGTGRPIGVGKGDTGGVPRANRWLVEFADEGDLNSYALQLDFFGIELAAISEEGQIFYVSDVSGDKVVRQADLATDDSRLLMSWQDGSRMKADHVLLKQAGVNQLQDVMVVHFYPAEVEQQLARLEKDYGNRQPEEIRRTTFRIRSTASGYEFFVASQRLR